MTAAPINDVKGSNVRASLSKVFLIILALTLSSEILADDELPSKMLVQEMNQLYGHRSVDNLKKNINKPQLSLITQAWNLAGAPKSVDNRAYLVALSIELYNSLPPDLMQEITRFEDGYGERKAIPDVRSWKELLLANYIAVQPGSVPLHARQADWEEAQKLPHEQLHTFAIEWFYLYECLREQIANGLIIIDAHEAPPSVNANEIDLQNPTYYAVIRSYMNRMKPAMDAGIPPWEAEAFLANYSAPKSAPAIISKSVAENPKPAIEVNSSGNKEDVKQEPNWVWYIVALGVAIGLLGVVTGRLIAVSACRKK